MSHFTRIKTQMAQQEYLLMALKDLDLQYEQGNLDVRGFGGQRTPVQIKVATKNHGYDIGFRKTGEAYEMVADWWGIRGVNRESLLQQLTQRYAYHTARAKLEAQGFTLVTEEKQKDGQVHLVLRRMA